MQKSLWNSFYHHYHLIDIKPRLLYSNYLYRLQSHGERKKKATFGILVILLKLPWFSHAINCGTHMKRVWLFTTPWTARLLCPWDSPGKNTGVSCHFLLQGNLSTQGSNSGLLHCRQSLYQLSYEGSPKRKWKWLSPVWLFATHSPWNSPGQNIGVSSLSLLQGIFSTQGSNPDLPHCRQILHQLSHKGNPCKCNIVINEQSCVFIIKSLSISVF